MKRFASICLISLLSLLVPPAALAIEFDEVREFDDVFRISGSAPGRDRLEVRLV